MSNAHGLTACFPAKEVGTLIQAMGTGIGRDDFDIEKAALSQDRDHDRC